MPTVMNGVSLNALTTVDTWSALSLFANGEQGTWYDPSDMSTMFQNAAGTTPVTAVEQPVGLILDKSKNLAFGPELVGATWNCSDATWSQTGSTLTAVNGTGFSCYQSILTLGRWYKITFEIFDYSSGSIVVRLGNQGEPSGFSASANGTYSAIGLCAGDTAFYWMGGGTFNGKIRNISVRELPGNHANQSTAASRPVLSARVNLLTQTEAFDNAVWTKSGLVTAGMANVTTAPDGTTTADQLIETAATAIHYAEQSAGATTAATNHTVSVAIKANGRQYATVSFIGATSTLWVAATFDLSGGGSVSNTGNGSSATYVSSSITSLGSGWFRCTVTGSHTNNSNGFIVIQPSNSGTPTYSGYSVHSYTGDGVSGVYIWGADLRVTNVGTNLPAYQRVGAAVTGTTNPAVTGVPDYDTAGFPLYLKFDGVDDSLATGSIDFSATDKMTVLAGVRKLSDAAVGQLVELSENVSSLTGSFSMPASDGGAFWTAATNGGNGGLNLAVVNAGSLVAPISTVNISLLNNALATGDVTFRVNGTERGTSTQNTGSNNFGNYPLYIGRRAGATLPFNGHLYSLIVRGALSNSSQIENAENYINSKTKAY